MSLINYIILSNFVSGGYFACCSYEWEELMLLGFISLLLTVTQDPISNICVPKSIGNSWHPCDDSKYANYADLCASKVHLIHSS